MNCWWLSLIYNLDYVKGRKFVLIYISFYSTWISTAIISSWILYTQCNSRCVYLIRTLHWILYGHGHLRNKDYTYINYNWRPPSLSELTPMVFNTGLTHLGSEASKYTCMYEFPNMVFKIILKYIFQIIFKKLCINSNFAYRE